MHAPREIDPAVNCWEGVAETMSIDDSKHSLFGASKAAVSPDTKMMFTQCSTAKAGPLSSSPAALAAAK